MQELTGRQLVGRSFTVLSLSIAALLRVLLSLSIVVLFLLFLSIPLVIAFGLVIYWLAEDTDGTRVALQSAAILLIISVALVAAWNAVYFNFLYKDENVATGNDGIGYITVTVKQQVVFSLWIAAVVCAFFAYYICILSHYKELYRKQQITDWLKDHGPEAGLPFNHEDEKWPPLTAKEQKEADDEKKDKAEARRRKREAKKKEHDDAEAKKNAKEGGDAEAKDGE
jgi:hypothetical protein